MRMLAREDDRILKGTCVITDDEGIVFVGSIYKIPYCEGCVATLHPDDFALLRDIVNRKRN